jgi:hypothetical protein
MKFMRTVGYICLGYNTYLGIMMELHVRPTVELSKLENTRSLNGLPYNPVPNCLLSRKWMKMFGMTLEWDCRRPLDQKHRSLINHHHHIYKQVSLFTFGIQNNICMHFHCPCACYLPCNLILTDLINLKYFVTSKGYEAPHANITATSHFLPLTSKYSPQSLPSNTLNLRLSLV